MPASGHIVTKQSFGSQNYSNCETTASAKIVCFSDEFPAAATFLALHSETRMTILKDSLAE